MHVLYTLPLYKYIGQFKITASILDTSSTLSDVLFAEGLSNAIEGVAQLTSSSKAHKIANIFKRILSFW